jgi:hypothetical protein
VNTLIRPHFPIGSEPTRDDDPTGVRDLLSSLPEPDPMPEHLVERINASLAAEQAQRATTVSGGSVTPLLATGRRRARLLFAVAGAAAAVVVVAVVGTNMFTSRQSTTISSSAAVARSAGAGEASGGVPPSAADKAPAGRPVTPSLVQIGLSMTQYTQKEFVTQAETLLHSAPGPIHPQPAESNRIGPAGTVLGLKECLSAIGVSGAQMVRADVAFYEGQPAVIIVATTNGEPVAYAVGRQCSHTGAAVLRPATPLP